MIENNDLPKGWTIAKFEDLLDYIQPTNYIVKSTEYKDTYKTPVLTAGKSFIKGYTNETDGIFNQLPTIIFDDFTTATQFVNFSFKVKSSAMKILQPTCDLVNIKLAYYFMQIQNIKGDTHKRFWISEYSQLPVPLAPLNEQKRILDKIEELITDLDKGIEYLETAQQQLKVYRQSVLKWAFEGKLTNDKDIRLGKLNELVVGVEYGSAAKSLKTGKIPVLRMGNIQNGKFEWDDLVYTTNELEIKKYFLEMDDILFNRTNSPEWVGKTAIYKGERPAIFAGYLIRIKRKKDKLDPDFLNYYLNSQMAKNHGNRVKSFGVNQSNINGTKLKQYPFPIASIDSQKNIVKEIESRLSVCDKIEETIETSLLQAEALRLSIIKRAFEGKLVPQNPSDEPAEKLLERIRAAKGKVKPEKEEKVKTSKKKTQLA
jgi:type I restriction enzyme, S subunit